MLARIDSKCCSFIRCSLLGSQETGNQRVLFYTECVFVCDSYFLFCFVNFLKLLGVTGKEVEIQPEKRLLCYFVVHIVVSPFCLNIYTIMLVV
jgi:hypothetical protein